jgi:hypothetical protein
MGGVRFRDDEKALLVAAGQRYGAKSAVATLKLAGRRVCTVSTLSHWLADGDVLVTEAAMEAIENHEREAGRRWLNAMDVRMEESFGAYDQAVEDRNFLGMQQAQTAIGIQFDKIRPVARGSGVVGVGQAGVVNMILLGSAELTSEEIAQIGTE